MNGKETTTGDFLKALASEEPTPGGGGASALCGALGAALASMVGNLTTGKKKYAQYEQDTRRILESAEALRERLIACVDEDAACFEPLSRAYGIPKDDPFRDDIMEKALNTACSAPMNILRLAAEAVELHGELLVKGSRIMLSDVGVGVLCCQTALKGAALNVLTNTRLMKNRQRAEELNGEVNTLLEKYAPMADKIYGEVFKSM